MTKQEAKQLVAVIFAAYQNANIREKTIEIYETMLMNLEFEPTKQAVMRLIGTSRFLPTIAEIREQAVNMTHGPARTGVEAWGDVVNAIRFVGSYGCPQFEDPCTAECVRLMGWRTLCLSENDVADRARFAELYDNLQERERRDLVAGHRLPPARGIMSLDRVPKHTLQLIKGMGEMPKEDVPQLPDPKAVKALMFLEEAAANGQLTEEQQAALQALRAVQGRG